MQGFIYILAVRDIELPVCKIGMTTRTPVERCAEINKSSTGDFLWKVSYSLLVNDCKLSESIVHKKLIEFKQRNREFFNLTPDEAYRTIKEIIDSQNDIKVINETEHAYHTNKLRSRSKRIFNKRDLKYAEILDTFTWLLGVKGKPFGQLNQPFFGMSDGNDGVQWSLSINHETEKAQLGVNLEGLKYNNWPITTFIQKELRSPSIEVIKSEVERPDNVFVRFVRDAWQGASRPLIEEKHLIGSELPLVNINESIWYDMLNEALSCLSKENNYRGRAKQTVTIILKSGKRESRMMDVSPHLTIWTPIALDTGGISSAISLLKPVYSWIVEAIK